MADISQITLPDGTTYDIKDPVARAAASDAGAGKIFYGVCSTGASTQTKVVTIDDFELFTGALIAVKFENVNTATSPKLNISGTGAVNMYSVGTTAVLPNAWVAGETLLFIYNGTSYMVADGGIASTSGYGVTKLNSSTSSTSTTEAATPSAVKSAYDLALEAKTSASDGKSLIASAITGKGVSTSATDTFATMADNIDAIETDIEITNGKIEQYKSANGVIPANTFVEKKFEPSLTSALTNIKVRTADPSYISLINITLLHSRKCAVVYSYGSSSTRSFYARGFSNSTGHSSETTLFQAYSSNYYQGDTYRLTNECFFVNHLYNSTTARCCVAKYDSSTGNLTRGTYITISGFSSTCALYHVYNYSDNKYMLFFIDITGGKIFFRLKYIEVDFENLSFTIISEATTSSTDISGQSYNFDLSENNNTYNHSEILSNGCILTVFSSLAYKNNVCSCVRLCWKINSDNSISYSFATHSQLGTVRACLILSNDRYAVFTQNYITIFKHSGTSTLNDFNVIYEGQIASSVFDLFTNGSKLVCKVADDRYVFFTTNTTSSSMGLSVVDFLPVPTVTYQGSISLPNTVYITGVNSVSDFKPTRIESFTENIVSIVFQQYSSGSGDNEDLRTYLLFTDIDISSGVIVSLSKIDGITIDEITTTTEGDVWVLDSN